MPAFSLEDFRAKSPDKPKFTVNDALGLLQRIGPLGGLLSPGTVKGHTLDPSLGGNLLDTAHGVSRGMSAGLLGAPVDLVSQVMSIPNYLGAPTPNFAGRTPVGGSDWLGQKMESLGLLRPMTGSANEVAGQLLGGVLSSPGAVAAVGQTAEQAALQAIRNASIPNRMSKQVGAINPSWNSLWIHRGGNQWDSSFSVNKRASETGAIEADHFKAVVEPMDSKALPLAKDLENVIGSKPRHFSFYNIQTAYGENPDAFGITGTGHAKEVISKATESFLSYLKNNQIVDSMIYSSLEPSRTKLYERLTKSVASNLPGFTGIKFSIPGKKETFFSVVRDEKLADVASVLRQKKIDFVKY